MSTDLTPEGGSMRIAQHEGPAVNPADALDVHKLCRTIGGPRVAMLTTISARGLIRGKPMQVIELDAQGAFWCLCRAPGPLDSGFNHYQRANLSFSDQSSNRYVSVPCRGELVRDRARIDALWKLRAQAWFPEGSDAAELVALKLQAMDADWWEEPDAGLKQALAIAASVVGGQAPGAEQKQKQKQKQDDPSSAASPDWTPR